MCQSFMESLYTGQIYISPEEAKEQRDAIYPVRIVNQQNKIVDYCFTQLEAKEKIKKRNEALFILGHTPKKYNIITKNQKSEYDKRKTKLNSNGESR